MNGYGSSNRKAPGRPRRNNSVGDFDGEPDATTQAPVTGGVFKSAAFEVLKQEQRLMTSGEITKYAMERKLLKCSGKTPEATMASALYTEVRKKAMTTVFIKPKEGLFGLKAWLQESWLLSWLAQEGIDPADLLDPGGGQLEPNPKKVRTSYNGTAARGASGTGYAPAFAGSGQRVPAAPRASLTGIGAPHVAAGGTAQRASLTGMAPAAAAGGGLRTSLTGLGAAPGYGAAPRPPLARTVSGAAAAAAGGGADSASNLQLLLDAADEIEGGVPEDPLAAGALPVRRPSEGSARQAPPGRPRQPSHPPAIGRARPRDEDDYGEGEEADEDPYGEESHEVQLLRIQQAALQHRLRQQQQQQQHWRRQPSRPQGRPAARSAWEGHSDEGDVQKGGDAVMRGRGAAGWPDMAEGMDGALGMQHSGAAAGRSRAAGVSGGRAAPSEHDPLLGRAYTGLAGRQRPAALPRARDADMAEGGVETSGEDEATAMPSRRDRRPPPAAERRGSPGGLPPGSTPAHRIFLEQQQRGVLPTARRSPLPKAGQRGQPSVQALRASGGSTTSSAGAASAGGGASSVPGDDGGEPLPTTEQVVEHLRAVLASNGALRAGPGSGSEAAGAASQPPLPGQQAAGPHASLACGDSNNSGVLDASFVETNAPQGVAQWGQASGGVGAVPREGKDAGVGKAPPDPGSGSGEVAVVLAGGHREAAGRDAAAQEPHAPYANGTSGGGEAKPSAPSANHGVGGAACCVEPPQQQVAPRESAESSPEQRLPRGAAAAGDGSSAHAPGATPSGAPIHSCVAVHDAMNSPDSQTAVPQERGSPDADMDMAHHSKPGRPLAGRQPYSLGAAGFVAAARRGVGGASHQAPAAATGVKQEGGAKGQTAACGVAGRAPLHADADAKAQQHQQGGPVAQLALLQTQHLKLLPQVEAARAGDVPDPEPINRIRQQVLDMETRMGALHPETGRAYVLLARVLEHKGTVWSLSMAERALLRAWTIVGMGSAGSAQRRPSESSAAAVAGVAAAAAAESGAVGIKEMLGQLPDSFSTFQYLVEQIRLKHGLLQMQQQQQLATLLRAAFAASNEAAGGGGGAAAATSTAASDGDAGLGPGAAFVAAVEVPAREFPPSAGDLEHLLEQLQQPSAYMPADDTVLQQL